MKSKKLTIALSLLLCICTIFSFSSCSNKEKIHDTSKGEASNKKTIADFNFNDMQGMNTWVKIDDYNFDTGTIKIIWESGRRNSELNYTVNYSHELRYETIVFTDTYYYINAVDYYGTEQDFVWEATDYTITSDDSIRNNYFTYVMETDCNVENNYLIIKIHSSSTELYAPIDLIDWNSGELDSGSITYKFK